MTLLVAVFKVDDEALSLFIVITDETHTPATMDAVRSGLHRFELFPRSLEIGVFADKQFDGFFVHVAKQKITT